MELLRLSIDLFDFIIHVISIHRLYVGSIAESHRNMDRGNVQVVHRQNEKPPSFEGSNIPAFKISYLMSLAQGIYSDEITDP